MLEQLLADYPNDVRLVLRHFPLPSHPLSLQALQAVEAAGLQGKYYEFSNQLFAKQSEWTSLDAAAFETWLSTLAESLALDPVQFLSDLKSDALVQKAKGYQQAALAANVTYTPFVLVNGRTYQNMVDLSSLANLRSLVKLIKGSAGQFNACPPEILQPGKKYQATIETEIGNIVFSIAADQVPLSANALVWLIQQGWYDNTDFYYVNRGIKNDVEYAITGDHSKTGAGTPGFNISTDLSPKLAFDQAGTVGFLNGSQIFLTYNPEPDLTGRYTVVGKIVQGMDIFEKLAVTTPAGDGSLSPGTRILRVTVQSE